MEKSKQPDTESKTMIISIRMLKKCSDNFNSIKKDIETAKKKKSKIKNIVIQMEYTRLISEGCQHERALGLSSLNVNKLPNYNSTKKSLVNTEA